MLFYVILTLPPVEKKLCERAEKELSILLQTPVSINSLSFAPFNRLTLRGISVMSNDGDTIMQVRRLGAGVKLTSVFGGDKIIFNFAEIIGLNLHLTKQTPQSPLNIDPIIKALAPKNRKKNNSKFNCAVNAVIIRQSKFTYDVISEPFCEGKFDRNHIYVDDFRGDISLPEMSNNDFAVDISRIALNEQSGLTVEDLHGNYIISDTLLSISGMQLRLPNTTINIGDTHLKIDGWNDIIPSLSRQDINLKIENGSCINPVDFKMFIPALGEIDTQVEIDTDIKGSLSYVDIGHISLNAPDRKVNLLISGNASHLNIPDSLQLNLPVVSLRLLGNDAAKVLKKLVKLPSKPENIIENLGTFTLNGSFRGSMKSGKLISSIESLPGSLTINADYTRNTINSPAKFTGKVETSNFNLSKLLNDPQFGLISMSVNANGILGKGVKEGKMEALIENFTFKENNYDRIELFGNLKDDVLATEFHLNDSLGSVNLNAEVNLSKNNPSLNLTSTVAGLNLNSMKLIKKYPGYKLSADISAEIKGFDPSESDGVITIGNLRFISEENPSLTMNNLTLTAAGSTLPSNITLRSDFIDMDIRGSYCFETLVPEIKEILRRSFPTFFPEQELKKKDKRLNDFVIDASIKYSDELNKFLSLPVNVIYPVSLNATVNRPENLISLDIDAPYLQQKDKLIEGTALKISVDTLLSSIGLLATTQVPTQNGQMTIELKATGENNRLDSDFKWQIARQRQYKGDVNLSTLFSRDENNQPVIELTVNPSSLVFNDSIWSINKALITASKQKIAFHNFDVRRNNQFVTINGSASSKPEDVLILNLLNVNLDYIFESLGIEKAMLGGDASGTFYASQLFSPEPKMLTPGLSVKNISYNKVVFGDAIVKSHWDNETRGITLDAVISQPNKETSYINGAIYPMNESLDLKFNCKKINVAFLKPYMEAFTSDVSGLASGYAHLFGTFKYIDLEGAVYAEDLKLKLDFTNTVYSCNDSVIMKPGRIDIKDVTLYDIYGNTATLNGVVTHKFFKEPGFDFAITNARNFLSYDVTSAINPDWYGRIFGNGSAFVKGEPGVVNISVDMTTAPKSTFTFVLSDLEEASEYSFITFRDRQLLAIKDSIAAIDPTPQIVKELKNRIKQSEEGEPSVYNMNFLIGVTPQATINLVMDPIGGDRIRANGSGNLKMDYGSANEDLRMYGKYTLDRGSYNFTLQDIIIKDFTIKPGSSISFNGDPFAAQLNIEATYAVTANLSDLDKSFLQDKDLNRTNVPVHALMKVSGDIRQPDIAFDLEFPTLTSDTYRKVKSIVSTEDMMNRQIIYLLALNRFYTPDYMGSTTKGNELVSVASSTISSQLSNMLGQLSENWSIAPNVRSDRGDFSDVEVDLMLSSNLLNNRLLFNGNFGYRDKSLNTNQFIGDFDLEYLLNRSGSVRLKAYNRYNDQNYYLRTATTTQGVGVMFKRDFDNIFSFLRKFKKNKKEPAPVNQTDSVINVSETVEPTDSTLIETDDFIIIKSKE